jgi:C_GCAxxG_C_C family probable redox protein
VAKKPSQRALELFAENYNCAQSVFAACASEKSLAEAGRLAVAAAFGGGLARQGEVCGALTGALMALGEKQSAALASDPVAARDAVYAQASELISAFLAAHGSILCRELTGCPLYTEEGRRDFKEKDIHNQLCTKLVTFAAEWVESHG